MDEILKTLKASVLMSENPPELDIYNLFIAECNKAVRISGMSRPMIADRMNDAFGGENVVTAVKINKWFSPATDQFMPVHLLPAFCWAIRSIEPANVLLKPLMFKAVDQRGQLFQQYAEMALDATERQNQVEQMAQDLLRLVKPE